MAFLFLVLYFLIKQIGDAVAGVEVDMSPVDECLNEDCFDAGCVNQLIISDEPLIVNTNQVCRKGQQTLPLQNIQKYV